MLYGTMVVLRRSAVEFRSDRSWAFDDDLPSLWDRIADLDHYESWWPWLHRFDPGAGFTSGARWECEVAPPLPYVVRFTVVLEEIDEQHRVTATVIGDVQGSAVLETVGSADGGSSARLTSLLAPANPILRGFGLVARPLVQWGHDWVLDQGQRQFVRAARGG
jgi:hypothetical protein